MTTPNERQLLDAVFGRRRDPAADDADDAVERKTLVVPGEGGNPAPPPDPDEQMREYVRDLFDRP